MSDPVPTVDRVEELRLSHEADGQIGALLALCYRTDFEGRSFYQNRHHCRFMVRSGAQLIGHLAVCYRAVRLGDEPVDIIGIGEVAVHPDFRRRGICAAMLDAAIDDASHSIAEFALLFGEASIYSGAGFVSAQNSVTTTEMRGAQTLRVETKVSPHLMVRPLTDRTWDFKAPLDLAGFSF